MGGAAEGEEPRFPPATRRACPRPAPRPRIPLLGIVGLARDAIAGIPTLVAVTFAGASLRADATSRALPRGIPGGIPAGASCRLNGTLGMRFSDGTRGPLGLSKGPAASA